MAPQFVVGDKVHVREHKCGNRFTYGFKAIVLYVTLDIAVVKDYLGRTWGVRFKYLEMLDPIPMIAAVPVPRKRIER